MELTVLIPCLNEEKTIVNCINKAKHCMQVNHIDGEVLVSDNGSTDASVMLSEQAGARVVSAPVKGYGAALKCGIAAAKGKYCIMADADESYDFNLLMPYVDRLRAGYDLVMGNRFTGGIEKGAMPPLHRYLGTPVISMIGRVLYHNHIGDYNCGMRGFNRQKILDLHLQSDGMEFASEMIVQSSLHRYLITEVPTTLSKDKRNRRPYLNTWSDGYRHLKVLLQTKYKSMF